MIAGHAYVAMLVTGCLHCILGLAALITPIVGLKYAPVGTTYHTVAIIPGVWILLVGALGIASGIEKLQDNTIRQLKIAHMVTAILSASLFTLLGLWMYSDILVRDAVRDILIMDDDYADLEKSWIIAKFGITFIMLECVLAIVSSSICCCCSPTTPVPGVIIQQPPQQIISSVPGNTTILYQHPFPTGIPYQTLQN